MADVLWPRSYGLLDRTAYVLRSMPYGLCLMAHVLWPMSYGPCLMVYVSWPISYGLGRLAHALWPMPYGPCLMARVVWPMSGLHLMAHVLCHRACLHGIERAIRVRAVARLLHLAEHRMSLCVRACGRACSGCMGVRACLLGHEVGRVRH